MDKPRTLVASFLNDGSKKKYFEFSGDSSMSKPTGGMIAQGSLFHEVDTATWYAYDETTQTWYEQIKLGGDD